MNEILSRLRLQQFYGTVFAAGLAVLPLICVVAPRFAGLGPVMLALGMMIFYGIAFRRLPSVSRVVLLWALAFPALMAASALWGIHPAQALDRAVRTLPVTISGAVLFTMARDLDAQAAARFRALFVWSVLAAGVFCAVELYAKAPLFYWLHETFHPERKFNLSRLNRSVIVFALSAIPAFYCAQHNFLLQQKKTRMTLALALVTLVVLAGTSSQSAQLAMLLALVFYVAFPYEKKIAWQALAAILCAALLAAPWMAQFLFSHFAALAADTPWLRGSYMPHRMEIWDFVSRRALERPLLGHGAEATRDIKDFATARLYHPTAEVLHPHNFAVQLWIEFGVLGAVLAGVFFRQLLVSIEKTPVPSARVLLAVFIACLSVAATGYGLWQSWWLGLFCLLLGFAGAALPLEESRNPL